VRNFRPPFTDPPQFGHSEVASTSRHCCKVSRSLLAADNQWPYLEDLPRNLMDVKVDPAITPLQVRLSGPVSLMAVGRRQCRILYLVGQLGCGGAERQLCYLLHYMDREVYSPGVVVLNYSVDDIYVGELHAMGVPLYYFPPEISNLAKLEAIRRLAGRLKAEVIHSFSLHTNFAAYWAALATNTVAIGSVRGDFSRAKKSCGFWRACLNARWPRRQVFNSLSSADKAKRYRELFRPKHIDVVRNGLDLQRFSVRPVKWAKKNHMVGLGSMLPLKRWDRLLRIVWDLKRRGCECTVRIAGDGPQRSRLESQARELAISDSVEFIGVTRDVSRLLEDAKFLVHTSDTEGCPNAVMEAMACGRAVIAMDTGDIPALVEDQKSGFVVAQGDEEGFRDRILQLLADDDLCQRMGSVARAKAERDFGLGKLVTEMLHVYKSAGWGIEPIVSYPQLGGGG
jgi:glycosyltransferase involved in cell wall biosynthesis